MNLDKLNMYRSYTGEFHGKAGFVGEAGEVTLNLNQEQCKQVLIVLVDALINTAKDTAQRLTVEVIDAVVDAKRIEVSDD
jgi:hypothetical protein